MKVFLLVLCSCLYLNAKSQFNNAEAGYFIGKWKSVKDSASSKSVFLFFIDKETVEITYDTVKFQSKYRIELGKDSSILTLAGGKRATQKMVVIPVDENVFLFNSIENHRRYLIARNAEPGKIAWGGSNPAPIKFERQ